MLLLLLLNTVHPPKFGELLQKAGYPVDERRGKKKRRKKRRKRRKMRLAGARQMLPPRPLIYG